MKAAEAKSVASPAKSSSSFFSKGAESSFFSDSPAHADFFQRKRESSAFFVQTKLNVGEANDRYEKEADSTAERVVQKMEDKDRGKKNPVDSTITPIVQKKCEACQEKDKLQKKEAEHENVQMKTAEEEKLQRKEKEEEKIHRKQAKEEDKQLQKQANTHENRQRSIVLEDGKQQLFHKQYRKRRYLRNIANRNLVNRSLSNQNVSPDAKSVNFEKDDAVQRKVNHANHDVVNRNQSVENNLAASKGTGRPLPEHILKQMESSFGVDFSQVRIHDNSTSVQMSKDLNAQAFTHGNDIYFNIGKFDVNSNSGKLLLAHELTHTIQQGGSKPKQVQQKSAHVSAGPASPAAALSSTDPKIAKQDEEDGFLLAEAKEALWSLLQEASPEVYDILRNKGFSNWAKEKVANFVNTTISTLSEPIKLGASIINMVKTNFDMFKVWLGSAIERLKAGDCTPFIEATDFITNILEGIADPVLEKLKAFLAPIKSFIDYVWNDIGKPIWDFVSRVFGKIWDGIKWVAEKIWNHIQTVISVFADIWHWFAQAIGFEGDDQDSLWEQIKRKVLNLWEEIKQKLEPYKTQLMVLGGIILMLSPAGPFIIAGAMLTGIMFAASKIRHYLMDRDAIIKERGFFQGVLIPGLYKAIQTLSSFLKAKLAIISTHLRLAVISLQSIPKDASAIFMDAINMAVNWLTDKFEAMEAWANVQATRLIVNLEIAFARIQVFLQPIIRILGKVGRAMTNYLQLGFLILDDLFHSIPKCIRDKIIAFFVKYVFKYIPFLKEVKDVEGAWAAMQKKTMQILDMMFVHGDVKGALWEVFNLLLEVLKFPKDLAVKVFNKAFEVFDTVIEKPKVFFVNMLQTAKLGFIGFFERKWTHLKDGFTTWLFDATKGSPIYIPRAFNFSEIFKMLGSIFSVGMEKVYKSIEKKRGKELAAKVKLWVGRISRGASKAMDWIVALHEHSLDEIIQMIRDKGAELLQTLVDSVIDWLVSNIIKKVSAKIVSMLDPTGVMAVVNSIIAFYSAVETAIEKAREILELVENVLDNVSEVMAGAFMNAALKFENNLQKAITLFLEFLANQIGESKLGKKIKEMAKTAEKWIDDKIDWLVDKMLAAGDWLKEKWDQAVDAVKGWLGLREEFTVEGEEHAIYFSGKEDNAEMMVASEPMSMQVLFNLKEKEIEELPEKGKKVKSIALNGAKAVYSKINGTKTKIRTLKEGEEKSRLESDLNKFFNEIIPFLIVIGVGRLGEKDLPETEINYVPQGDKSGKVTADPLSLKQGKYKGSRPKDKVRGWESHIMTIPDYDSNYVRLHLLSEKLHGPGLFWNLTPGRKKENTDMQNQAEAPAKQLAKKNVVMWYDAQIGSYYSEPDFADFATSIQISYGFKEKDKNGKWKRVEQASYKNGFEVTKPGEKGTRELAPSYKDMAGRYWDVLFAEIGSAPSRDVFRKLINDRNNMNANLYNTWDKFIKTDAFQAAEMSSPGLLKYFNKAIKRKLIRK